MIALGHTYTNMPELPEVETISRQLKRSITGKKIVGVDVLLPKAIYANNEKGNSEKFKESIKSAEIINVKRKAKVIIIELSNNRSILFHLKMTGQLVFEEEDKPYRGNQIPFAPNGLPAKSTVIIFHFSDKSKLYFNDMRQFGYAKLLLTAEVKDDKFIRKLGPEPFSKNFDYNWFSDALSKKKLKIKNLLMDQEFISGIGNIYANEAAFLAKIHPDTYANKLDEKEKRKLFDAILQVLQTGINVKGASDQSYIDIYGKKGDFMDYAKVYRQKQCHDCKSKIVRITQNGRGTFYCPRCQKVKK